MIPDVKKEEVRQAADIVDVVSDYVKLRRTGSSFTGLCPFHNEKTPSFNVSPSLGIYKCFGCGEGGDVFNFVMKIDGVGFEEAVRTLADRYHVTIPEREDVPYDPREHLKDGIYHALRFAGAFFHQTLSESEDANAAREYLKQRGYPWKIVRKYGLGFSPDSYDGLLSAATDAGINRDYLEASGLIRARDSSTGYYDTFRSRLMFPVFNPGGKVIAFGGRTLSKSKNIPKYINSPQTLVYNKSEVLYGIQTARNEIRKNGEIILVEGYTDVISMHQAGIGNVVSTSGTSLTTGQIRVMKRYGNDLLMIFDADAAGVQAAVRGIAIALQGGMGVRILMLPQKEDPDSFIRQYGAEGFGEYRKKKTLDFLRYLIRISEEQGRWDDPIERRKVILEILETIAVIPDELSRANYIHELGTISRIGDRTLMTELASVRNKMHKRASHTRHRPAGERSDLMRGTATPGQAESKMSPDSSLQTGQSGNDSGKKTELGPGERDAIRKSSAGKTKGSTTAKSEGTTTGKTTGKSTGLISEGTVSGETTGTKGAKSGGTVRGKSTGSAGAEAGAGASGSREFLHHRRPGYEKELIRLMLVFGKKLILFIGSSCNAEEFEDPDLRHFFEDVMDRYGKEDPVTVEDYARREPPFPVLLGEIVLERYSVSELGMKKRGVNLHRDADPLMNARGALKALKLRYLDRTREQLLERFQSVPADERPAVQAMLIRLGKEYDRYKKTPLEMLFPLPADDDSGTSS